MRSQLPSSQPLWVGPLPLALNTSDADATYPNCYSEWRNGPYGPRRHGLARVLLLALVVLAVLLSSVVLGVVTWAWYEGIVTEIPSSIPGATAESVGTLLSILLVG